MTTPKNLPSAAIDSPEREQIRCDSLEDAVLGLGAPSRKATGEREELALVRASPCWWAPSSTCRREGESRSVQFLWCYLSRNFEGTYLPEQFGDETDPGCLRHPEMTENLPGVEMKMQDFPSCSKHVDNHSLQNGLLVISTPELGRTRGVGGVNTMERGVIERPMTAMWLTGKVLRQPDQSFPWAHTVQGGPQARPQVW